MSAAQPLGGVFHLGGKAKKRTYHYSPATVLFIARPGLSRAFGQVIAVVCAPSCHVPALKVKTSEFKNKFEIHHTAHTMDCDDPELDAFKSNLVALIGVIELGKNAALLSNLCPNASDP